MQDPSLKIPPTAKEIMDGYLSYVSHEMPEEAILLALYVGVSRILCFNRVTLKKIGSGGFIYPNIYAMLFIRSGLGKDSAVDGVDALMEDVLRLQQSAVDEAGDRLSAKVSAMKTTKNGDSNKLKYDEYERRAITEKYSCRSAHEVFEGATPEGFLALRSQFEKIGFGATHFRNDEFFDYLTTNDQNKQRLVSLLKTSHTKGKTGSITTKGEQFKKLVPVENVPSSMLVYSDIFALGQDEVLFAEFHKSLASGMARRATICSNPKRMGEETEGKTDEEITAYVRKRMEDTVTAEKNIQKFKDIFNNIHVATEMEKINAGSTDQYGITKLPEGCSKSDFCVQNAECSGMRPCAPIYIPKHIEISEDLIVKIGVYSEKCKSLVNKNNSLTDGEIKHIVSNPWRAYKLAAIIAVLEHPDDLSIHEKDFEYAKNNIEFWAKQYRDTVYTKTVSDSERMIQYILSFQDELHDGKGLLIGDISSVQFAPKQRGPNKIWTRDIIEQVEEDLASTDKVLVIDKIKNATYHRIEELASLTEAPPEPITADLSHPVTLSFSQSKAEFPVDGYKPITCKFSSLAKNISKGAVYSPAIFTDGYRDTAHLEKHGNLIIIDVDGGMTISEAQEKLKGYMALIVTTRSHGVKEGDRFRILLPTEKPLAPKHNYAEMMKKILFHLDMKDQVDIGATGDQVRFYFPSPKDALAWYSESNVLLDWESFDIERPMAKHVQKSYTPPTSTGLLRNAVPDAVFTDKSNKTYSWRDFDHLQGVDTSPVRCIYPQKHTHGDKHPSAFIGRHEKNNTLMMKCTGCGSLVFEK